MHRHVAIVRRLVQSLAAGAGLALLMGCGPAFPAIAALDYLMAGDERFAGIDRDPATPAPPPYQPHADDGSPSRAAILQMLRKREFAALTSLLEAKRGRVAHDIRHESEWHRVVQSFDIADRSITPLIEDWVAAAPASVVPLIASGTQMYALAFDARGTKYATETTVEQFAGMHHFLEKAVIDARAVLERDPKEVLAHRLLIFVAMAGGSQEECGMFAREGLTAAPASMRIRWALAMCRLPRWGGSTRAVEAIWEKARPFVIDNPDLTALAGVVAYDKGRLAKGEEAIKLFDQALAVGAHSAFYLARSRAHYNNNRSEAALEDAKAGLLLSPEDPDLLEYQFRALVDLGRLDHAGSTLDVLAAVDPTNPNLPKWREDAQHRMRAESDTPSDFTAILELDRLLIQRRDYDAVIRHWTNYLAQAPTDGRAYLERAGTHRLKGDMASARADIVKACQLENVQACSIAKRQGW
jgi:Flp pilus assembly protein TadD